jgi:hypothetical protein
VNAAATSPAAFPARGVLVRAVCALWLPVLVPIATGVLRGCGHCQTSYVLSVPVVPGVLVPAMLGLDDAAFVVVAGAATLAAFAVLTIALHELPRWLGHVVQGLAAVLVAFEAIGYAHALRA